jgi:23S rRNA (guanosine2251-2'-O)-methyltransferase
MLMGQRRSLAGFHAVTARLRNGAASIEALYYDPSRRDARMQQLLSRATQAGVRPIAADATRLAALAGASRHQGVVAVCRDEERIYGLEDILEQVGPDTLVLLLDGITDPRNLGACLRTAEAAGVTAVVFPRDRSASLTAVAMKAASGAAESLAVIAVVNLARAMDDLKDAGVRIVGADSEAKDSLFELDLRGPLAWALGAEGHGLRRLTRERCDTPRWIRLPLMPLAGHARI